ncbi:hypothetical protein ACFL0F_02260 [Patescibacteria group bacterium]
MKPDLKVKAIMLREEGLSYSEIRNKVPVSKSSLSLWLRDVQLTSTQKGRLKDKIRAVQPYGAKAQKRIRIERSKKIIEKAKQDIGKINKKQLFHLGIVLYWAEGSKQRENNPSQRVAFANSDPRMISLFLKWLRDCLDVAVGDISLDLYLHSNNLSRETEIIKYWANKTKLPKNKFSRIYYKRDTKNKYRKNRGKDYYGLLRVSVRKSTDLNREIEGWTLGICERYGVM